jgi:tetratricopeptide (TPR) repeat protein
VADTSRIDGLRRRVGDDPASIAFAQLGEELRRAGGHDEAVRVCRAGLEVYPAYISARVTLGRALAELGRLDEARAEFAQVLRAAPDNLLAVRGMADLHQRCDAAPTEIEPAPTESEVAPTSIEIGPTDVRLRALEGWLAAILADRER